MSASTQHIARMSRPVKKLEKPRPLKIPNANRHSTIDTRLGTVEEIMALTDTVAVHLTNGNYDRTLQANILSLNAMLKVYGSKLEVIYKDQLDRAFVTFRNGCRDERLDYVSRLNLLELIELRATQWAVPDNSAYYKHKYNHTDVDIISISSMDSSITTPNVFQSPQMVPVSPITPQPLLLAPGELVKSSGKFMAPTKIPGKNYCKDEVVIRNSDSGKVMGIKGRRVHMIEELSETVISFQRVNPGAKERLVQITGPTEDKIIYAKQLMEETIRRNASPVRSEMPEKERLGSSSSLNSSTSDDSLRYQSPGTKRSTLLHSFSTSDATLGEYKYTVTVGDESLKITGTNLDLVRIAKLVLDEYFSPDSTEQLGDYGFEEETDIFLPVSESLPRINSQDSEESEDTYKVQHSKAAAPIAKSSSFKTKPIHVQPSERTEEFENSSDTLVYFSEASPPTPEEAKAMEALDTASQKKRGVTRTSGQMSATQIVTSIKILTYTFEELLHWAEAPLSHRPPDDWPRVIKDVPSIIRKLPIEWFDASAYTTRRLQEADALRTVQGVSETGSPEIE